MTIFRVSKGDSDDLGFAVTCLFTRAITQDEFTAWVYWAIEHAENDLPGFFFELDDFGPFLKDIYAAIGFAPSSGLSDCERDALAAIGYRRGLLEPAPDSIGIGERQSPEQAAACLARHPHNETRFRAAFPFLDADHPPA